MRLMIGWALPQKAEFDRGNAKGAEYVSHQGQSRLAANTFET